jgi:hypothetical protein
MKWNNNKTSFSLRFLCINGHCYSGRYTYFPNVNLVINFTMHKGGSLGKLVSIVIGLLAGRLGNWG